MSGPWFPTAHGRIWLDLLAGVAVAWTVLRQVVRLYRGRFTRQWKAVLDAYAEREIARDRRNEAPPAAVKTDRRDSDSLQILKDRVAGELTDLAYPVVLRQGVKGHSVDVELSIWKAIEGALQEMLHPLLAGTTQRPPASAIVLARLTMAVYQAARRSGFRGTFADVEFGLWDAFHTGSFSGNVKDLLSALFRGALLAGQEPVLDPLKGNHV
jgi:hypothetical protein